MKHETFKNTKAGRERREARRFANQIKGRY